MKRTVTQWDYLKAHRRASRGEEIAAYGKPRPRTKIHKSKKAYDRHKMKAGLRKGLPDFLNTASAKMMPAT